VKHSDAAGFEVSPKRAIRAARLKREQLIRQFEAENFGGAGVNYQLEFRGLRKMRRRHIARFSESEFAQTLSSGREKSNMRISLEGCCAAPHCQRKFRR
jgi:hypothetical protein